MDFGVAKLQLSSSNAKLTQAGVFLGTPAYCAPEQFYGCEVGPHTDIYALGATAFEMLTGRVPFEGDFEHIIHQKTRYEARKITALRADLPSTVEDLIATLLAPDPSLRPQTMMNVHRALLGWGTLDSGRASDTGIRATRISTGNDEDLVVMSPPSSGKSVLFVFLTVCLLLVLGGGFYWLSLNPAPQVETVQEPKAPPTPVRVGPAPNEHSLSSSEEESPAQRVELPQEEDDDAEEPSPQSPPTEVSNTETQQHIETPREQRSRPTMRPRQRNRSSHVTPSITQQPTRDIVIADPFEDPSP